MRIIYVRIIHTYTHTHIHTYTHTHIHTYTHTHIHRWPSASMKRSFTYLEHYAAWQHMHYVFAVDIDVAFVSYVGREILGDTVGTLHADNAFYGGSEVVGAFQSAWPVPAVPGHMWRQHDGTAAVVTRGVYETRPESQVKCVANCVGKYVGKCVGKCVINCVGKCAVKCAVECLAKCGVYETRPEFFFFAGGRARGRRHLLLRRWLLWGTCRQGP
jgi:hypothetical protein